MKLIKPLGFVAFLLLAFATGFYYRNQIEVQQIQQTVATLGIWAPVGFIALYALATVLFIPGSLMTLAGGFIFGPWYGTVYNLTGAVIGATFAFLIARYLASGWVRDSAGRRLTTLLKGVEREGWRFIAVVRLVPVLPFNLLNYALGLTSISLLAYVLASTVFMLPGAFAYTYVGSLGQTALAGDVKVLVRQILFAISLLVLLASIPYVIKRYREKDES